MSTMSNEEKRPSQDMHFISGTANEAKNTKSLMIGIQ
jgi:hypothetical protein